MKVLVACEFSGIVREAFKAKGHDAWSCDLLDTEIPGQHIKRDVLEILDYGWDLMIAHPPCTYLCNSGVRWLISGGAVDKDRYDCMLEASGFFNHLRFASDIPRIAIENPIPHRHARQGIMGIGDYDQLIHPHYFIESDESKATCLWLEGLPKLKRTQWLDKTQIKQSVWREPPSENRWKNRSRFSYSIAHAMAEQWS